MAEHVIEGRQRTGWCAGLRPSRVVSLGVAEVGGAGQAGGGGTQSRCARAAARAITPLPPLVFQRARITFGTEKVYEQSARHGANPGS